MDLVDISRMFFGLLAVLAMIGLCAIAAKKAGLAANGGAFGGKRRLMLVETFALDARRKLAIIRCDGREHLLLLGSASETVIDADLPARADALEAERPAPTPFAKALIDLARGGAVSQQKDAA